jgi:hypothetical protein
MNHAATYYEILDISRTASSAEIRAAWKKLAKLYHPDLLGDVEPSVRAFSEDKFKQINEAYKVLSNPVSRHIYDRRWAKVEEPSAASATHTSHGPPHRSSTRRRPARPKSTPRDKALGILITMGLLLCWGLAYVLIKAGSPLRAERNLVAQTSRIFADIADRAAKKGCLDSSDCRPYKVLAFREKMESRDGHTGLFIVQSPEGPFTAYCDDDSPGTAPLKACSKFAAMNQTIWLDDTGGQVCYYLDKQPWSDQLGQNYEGHAQCLKVVSIRKVPTAPAIAYKVLSYDSHYQSKDGHTGSFLLGSRNEIVNAYCDSSGSLLDAGTNPCSSLVELVGNRIMLNPALDDADSMCFDRESRWHLDEYGEYHLENRECLRVIERKDTLYNSGPSQFQRQFVQPGGRHP